MNQYHKKTIASTIKLLVMLIATSICGTFVFGAYCLMGEPRGPLPVLGFIVSVGMTWLACFAYRKTRPTQLSLPECQSIGEWISWTFFLGSLYAFLSFLQTYHHKNHFEFFFFSQVILYSLLAIALAALKSGQKAVNKGD